MVENIKWRKSGEDNIGESQCLKINIVKSFFDKCGSGFRNHIVNIEYLGSPVKIWQMLVI